MKKIVLILLSVVSVLLLTACSQVEEGEFPNTENMKAVDMSQEEMLEYLEEVEYVENQIYAFTLNLDMSYTYQSTEFTGDFLSGTIDSYQVEKKMVSNVDLQAFVSLSKDFESIDEMIIEANYDIFASQGGGKTSYTTSESSGQLGVYVQDEMLYISTDIRTEEDGVETSLSSKQKTGLESMFSGEDIEFNKTIIDIDEFTNEDMSEIDQMHMYKKGSVDYIEFSLKQDVLSGNEYFDTISDMIGMDVIDDMEQKPANSVEFSFVIAVKDQEVIQSAYRISLDLNDEYDSYFTFTVVLDVIDKMEDFPNDLDEYQLVPDLSGLFFGM